MLILLFGIVSQHLQFVQTLQDTEAEVNVWNLLAQLAVQRQEYELALNHLEHVRTLTRGHGLMNELRVWCKSVTPFLVRNSTTLTDVRCPNSAPYARWELSVAN